jgi:hypothetical protein
MQSERPELREAKMYTWYSLFIIIMSLPFSLMCYVLKDSAPSAIELMPYGIAGFFIGLLSLFIWYRKWKKLRKN